MSLHSLNLRSLSYRFWLILAVIALPLASFAQPRVTKNDAYATVEVSSGRITWYTIVGDSRLSYANKSFVSFKVGSKIYSNHDAPPQGVTGLPAGTLVRRGPSNDDTIVYTWSIDGLDFIQKVWGVAVSNEKAQIVAAWSVKNNSGNLSSIGTQFLLDVAVNNDGAKTLTKNGYRKTWAQYGTSSTKPVPPFFINFENDLPNAPTFDPGLSGQGWFNNPLLGLTVPYRVTVGDWRSMELVAWGPPALPGTDIGDNAILFEWLDFTAAPGKETKGPSMSYGTGDYSTCGGKLFGLIFYPKKLAYDPTLDRYIPNPFTYEAYVFNPDKVATAANVKLSLEVGPNLSIVGSTDPKLNEKVPEPDFINAEDVTYASWDIRADLVRNCTEPLSSWLRLSAVSSLGPPGLIDCEQPIELPCTERDIVAPLHHNELKVGDSIKTLDILDNRKDDKGIQRIDYTVTTGPAGNVVVTIPTLTACQLTPVTVQIRKLDSTIRNCVTFRTTDCAGNWSEYEVCLEALPLIPTPDTKSPRFTLVERVGSYDASECNALRDSLVVRDDSTNDDGLASVTLTPGYPVNNMRLVNGNVLAGASQHRFSVEVIDRFFNGQISVRATDVEGNFADTVYTYCTLPDTNAPVITVTPLTDHQWTITVDEMRHWDRLIDFINVTNRLNIVVAPDPAITSPKDLNTFSFVISIVDTMGKAGWCVQAGDNAGNRTTLMCQSYDPPQDVYPPVIGLTPNPATNPHIVTVNINDIHYLNNDTVNGRIWHDSGVAEVWFTNVIGMTIGIANPTVYSPALDQVPPFTIEVTDTNSTINPQACITIHARDSAGNHAVPYTWCYPIQGDIYAPLITGVDATKLDVDLNITDERQMDRGLKIIELTGSDNFQSFTPVILSSEKSQTVRLTINDRSKSAVGRLQAMDMWGYNSPNPDVKTNHTSYVNVAIWVQPFKIKNSHLILESGEFTLPIYLLKNDGYSVNEKGIRKYEFVFDIQGDPDVTFLRAESTGTLSDGWNVQTIPLGGRQMRIVAEAPASTFMTSQSAADTVVLNLVFNGMESQFGRSANIVIVPQQDETVLLNDGQDYIVTGPNSNAILPAPQSSLSNSTIVVAGICTPIETVGPSTVKSIMMEAVTPNPVSSSARIRFATGTDAVVNLKLYNALGEVVTTLVSSTLQPGMYQQEFTTQGLSSGTYYLRLESQGKVIERTVKVSK